MKALPGIRTMSMKVSSEELACKRTFVLEVLGGKEVYCEPGLTVLELPDKSILELYGPGANYPAFLFENNNQVLSFRVNDLDEAIEKACSSGMQLVPGSRQAGSCFSYCYIRDKQGNIFGLTN